MLRRCRSRSGSGRRLGLFQLDKPCRTRVNHRQRMVWHIVGTARAQKMLRRCTYHSRPLQGPAPLQRGTQYSLAYQRRQLGAADTADTRRPRTRSQHKPRKWSDLRSRRSLPRKARTKGHPSPRWHRRMGRKTSCTRGTCTLARAHTGAAHIPQVR